MLHGSSTSAEEKKGKVKFYAEEEVAALVRSLDRPQDNQLFSEDVVATYPNLASSYKKACPKRCDLATAARNALDGDYSYEPDLARLKDDVSLMVSNCVRFNGEDSPLSATAQDFEKFAMNAIQQFLESKTGGRRTSSLRFLQKATAAVAASDSHAAATANRGERDEELFPHRDLAQLISSLVRREDADAFLVDVATAYPELREAYETICPRTMNLNVMKQRAHSGVYTHGPPPAIGRTVADCLPVLREDVELIVDNCVRFNAKVEAWVSLAKSFQSFAHRRIDDYVLRKLPQLRGTETGSQRYTTPAATTTAVAAASSSDSAMTVKRPREEAPASSTAMLEATLATPAKRKSLRSTSAAASPSIVQVVADVAPSVQPTPLQPALDIPPRLRQRLLSDYLTQETVSLRLVGGTIALSDVVMPQVPRCAEKEEGGRSPGEGVAAKEGEKTRKAGDDREKVIASFPQDVTVRITEQMSVQAVVRGFQASVRSFFDKQRRRPDFADPFSFSQHEEASYLRVVDAVADQFERLFSRAFLYEKETADLHRHIAQQALRQAMTVSNSGDHRRSNVVVGGDAHAPASDARNEAVRPQPIREDKSAAADAAVFCWSAHVHYLYLVRFLVQFPQIASLAVATAVSSSSTSESAGHHSAVQQRRNAAANGSRGNGSLKISKDSVTVMQYVTKITQEFLKFVADFEDKLVSELTQLAS